MRIVLERDKPLAAPDATVDAADPAAVVDTYWPMISRIARAHERDADLCRDLVQDIAMALLRALPSWRGETPLRVFVARVAENRCMSHRAHAVRHKTHGPPEVEIPSPAPGPDELAGNHQHLTRLFAALDRLPPTLREAAVLALEGFEPREVAQVLGITANTAAQRLKRARDALRAALGQEDRQ